MSDSPVPTPPRRPRPALRRDAPFWRQATEGIGLVLVLSTVVVVTGLLLSFIVSLLF